MNNLTQIEKALLKEFESLAATFADLAQQQSTLSAHYSATVTALTNRQNRLETHLQQVSAALEQQNASTKALIEKASRLSGGWS
ncbi:MAG: hypothetical protein L3J37_11765 [Rhodobacteraceae bacterium]|nr:hypothetical protein [Paracoccaceae bacterium]